MARTQVIAVSLGAIEYTWPLTITEASGKDISSVTVELSLGSQTQPGVWKSPDVDTQDGTSTRTVQLLVGAASVLTPGDYWLWSKITDFPEVAPRRHEMITIQ